jgi:hypothetical protein
MKLNISCNLHSWEVKSFTLSLQEPSIKLVSILRHIWKWIYTTSTWHISCVHTSWDSYSWPHIHIATKESKGKGLRSWLYDGISEATNTVAAITTAVVAIRTDIIGIQVQVPRIVGIIWVRRRRPEVDVGARNTEVLLKFCSHSWLINVD